MDEKYCYKGTDVLINKFNIRNKEELYSAERKISYAATAILKNKPVKGNFDLKHLKAIHKAIFSDIYEWAGKIRTVDIAKSNLFCRVQFLDSYSQDIFGRLKRDKYLIGMDKQHAIRKLAEYMGDINALHPFREGNGRTQRQFIEYLAKTTGIDLNLMKTNSDEMMSASLMSFNTDYTGFEKIFSEIAVPMSLEEQERFLKEVSLNAYKEFKELKKQGLLPDRKEEFLSQEVKRESAQEKRRDLSMSIWKNVIENTTDSIGTINSDKKLDHLRDMVERE